MKEIPAIIFFTALTTVCLGQVQDNFSDGDFTLNPAWSGSKAQFTINAIGQLELNNSAAGVSYLSTALSSTVLDNTTWQFYVKQGFSPSGNNYGRIYLVSDQPDLTQPLSGYYLQLGETGSNDAIELFRQTGSTAISVCRGTSGKIATAFSVTIKVSRDNTGLWQLYVDYSGGSNYSLDASGRDLGVTTSSYFGVVCAYSASNSTKFYFDDFYVGPPLSDTTSPSVLSVDTLSENSVVVVFSEAIDQSSAETMTNYSGDHALGNPIQATIQHDGKTVLLSFATNFPNGAQIQLSISGVKDLAGNEMTVMIFPFMYLRSSPAKNKDIIFSELFPDPSPQVGLPLQEYIEIYNRSSMPINLSGWKLSDGISIATFNDQIIRPGAYLILCATANSTLFSGYGDVTGLSNFPTINNDHDNLILRSSSHEIIDSLNFTLDWYHDTDKQEGGWSLELIDINNTCGEGDNWSASEDPSGGTPGKQNSIFANKPDITGPQLLSVIPQSAAILILTFNEKLMKALSEVRFEITPDIEIEKIYFSDLSLTQIVLELRQAIALRQLYTISVSNLTDCAGNFLQLDFSQISFALPEPGDTLDIVINEILFNPRPGGVDFVEIFNKSLKYINLKNWKFSNDDGNPEAITGNDLILPPSGYAAFTTDPSALTAQYPLASEKRIFRTNLPGFPDDEGTVALITDRAMVVDHFNYTQKMHSSFVNDNEGVSLERISFSEKTNDPGNWNSASGDAGFATPGYVNSNARRELLANENSVLLDPEIFSPSAPGKDFSKIIYRFDRGGKVANIKVFDIQGHLIKTLANNETLGTEGFYRWDGDRDDGSRARMGYYVVWFEVFDGSGNVAIFRKRAVVGK